MTSETVLVPLTRGYFALIDACDAPLVMNFKWHASHDFSDGCGVYALCAKNWTGYKRMHRLLLNAPEGVQIDHANHNGLDNRRSNIRLATSSQQTANTRKFNKNGFRGVLRDRNKWRACLEVGGTTRYVNALLTAEDAARAYDLMAIKAYGEFAMLNFPAMRRAA